LPGHRQRRLAAADSLVKEAAEAVSDSREKVLDLRLGELGDLSGDGRDDAAGAHDGVGCPDDAP
jgi:hypothetical protein